MIDNGLARSSDEGRSKMCWPRTTRQKMPKPGVVCVCNVFHCDGRRTVTRDGFVFTSSSFFQLHEYRCRTCPFLFLGCSSSLRMVRSSSTSLECAAIECSIAAVCGCSNSQPPYRTSSLVDEVENRFYRFAAEKGAPCIPLRAVDRCC